MDSMHGLLTKGLGSKATCNLITARFNLGRKCEVVINVTSPIGGSGGTYPLIPGQAKNFYKPVAVSQEFSHGQFSFIRPSKQLNISIKVSIPTHNINIEKAFNVLLLDLMMPTISGIYYNFKNVTINNLKLATKHIKVWFKGNNNE